jgi:hypothetical protein
LKVLLQGLLIRQTCVIRSNDDPELLGHLEALSLSRMGDLVLRQNTVNGPDDHGERNGSRVGSAQALLSKRSSPAHLGH